MENRTNPSSLKVGDRLSRVSYVEVVGKGSRPGSYKLRNQEGLEWTISGDIIANEMYTASQYSETKKVSRTELVEALENAGDTIFTVVFDKKTTEKSVVDALAGYGGNLPKTKTALKKIAKDLMSGEERTLVGYLVNAEPKMGRSTVVDLNVPSGSHPLRLIDHRTIKSLVIRNTRYVLK